MLRGIVLGVMLFVVAYAEHVSVTTGEWVPYVGELEVGYGKTGSLIGEACKRAGYECDIVFMPWKRAWEVAKKGDAEATIVWVGSEDRAEEMHPSQTPIAFDVSSVFYNKNSLKEPPKISEWKDLENYKVVGVRSYYYTQKAEEAGVEVHKVNSADLAWKMLALGRADIYVSNEVVAELEMEKYIKDSRANIAKLDDSIVKKPMHIFYSRVNEDAKEFRKRLDAVLADMEKNGEIESYYK